jgi:hypothetical protein
MLLVRVGGIWMLYLDETGSLKPYVRAGFTDLNGPETTILKQFEPPPEKIPIIAMTILVV